jgi:hypothetical protein
MAAPTPKSRSRDRSAGAASARAICARLKSLLDAGLPGATAKIWHGGPVWFLDGHPVAGYDAGPKSVRLTFWNGRAFDEPGLAPVGKHRAAQALFRAESEVDEAALRRWLKKAAANVLDSAAYVRMLRSGAQETELRHRDGSLRARGWMRAGAKVGEWTTYDAKGRVVKVTVMKPKLDRNR